MDKFTAEEAGRVSGEKSMADHATERAVKQIKAEAQAGHKSCTLEFELAFDVYDELNKRLTLWGYAVDATRRNTSMHVRW